MSSLQQQIDTLVGYLLRSDYLEKLAEDIIRRGLQPPFDEPAELVASAMLDDPRYQHYDREALVQANLVAFQTAWERLRDEGGADD